MHTDLLLVMLFVFLYVAVDGNSILLELLHQIVGSVTSYGVMLMHSCW